MRRDVGAAATADTREGWRRQARALVATSAVVGLLLGALTLATAHAAGRDAVQAWFFDAPSRPVGNLASLRKRAEAGDKTAQLDYARQLFHSGKSSIAVVWLTEANNQGSIRAEDLLGLLYEKGEGVVQDLGQSRYFYGKAADQGYAPAEFRLGKLWMNFEFDDPGSLNQDSNTLASKLAEGAAMMRRAADQGYGPAQYAFGLALLNGNGVRKDPRLALAYFRLACAQGLAKAAYMAGWVYATSPGDLHDPELARHELKTTISLAGEGTAYARDAQALLLHLAIAR